MEDRNTVLRKWVEALRSGKYKQQYGSLKSIDNKKKPSYCALGLLLHIIADDKNIEEGSTCFIVCNPGPNEAKSLICFIPFEIEKALDIFQQEIVALNDNNHATFKEIADYIEQRYLKISDEQKRNPS